MNIIIALLFLLLPCINAPAYDLAPSEQELLIDEMTEAEIAEKIGELERAIRNFRFLADRAERDADRQLFIDTGHALHLQRHARWLRKKADRMERDLEILRAKGP